MKATGAKMLAAIVLCCIGLATASRLEAAQSEAGVLIDPVNANFYLRGSRIDASGPQLAPEPREIALLGLGLVLVGGLATRRPRQTGPKDR